MPKHKLTETEKKKRARYRKRLETYLDKLETEGVSDETIFITEDVLRSAIRRGRYKFVARVFSKKVMIAEEARILGIPVPVEIEAETFVSP